MVPVPANACGGAERTSDAPSLRLAHYTTRARTHRYHQQLLLLLSEVPDYAQARCRTLAIALLSFLRDDYYGAESRRDLDANELGMEAELQVRGA